MAVASFRRCRDATCSAPAVPSEEFVRNVLIPRMQGKDMVIFSYTSVTQVLVMDEPALLVTAATESGARQFAPAGCTSFMLLAISKLLIFLHSYGLLCRGLRYTVTAWGVSKSGVF